MCFFRLLGIGLVSLLIIPIAVARDRDAARQAYQSAFDYHEWLNSKPLKSRTQQHYARSIFLFRRVIDHDPTYGACDDSLFAIATLFDEKAEKFGSIPDLDRAIYYYEFVAREYPLTRFRKQAIARAAALRNQRDRPPSLASQSTTAGLALLSEIRYWSNDDYTRVVIQLDREVEFKKSVLSGPDRIYFDLEAVRIDPKFVERTYDVNGSFIRQIRVAENRPDIVRVVLDFQRINQHTVFALYDPYRIVIDTRGKPRDDGEDVSRREQAAATLNGTDQASSASSGSDDSTSAGPTPSPTHKGDWTWTRTLGLKVGRVVIDPGHGGRDTGTIGPSGLKEKDLVLDIAYRLKERLEQELGTDVLLTRRDDRFVPLEERTAIANQNSADLFISIHANASRNRGVSGIETYVLDFARSAAEREIASRENASAQRNIRELENLLRQIALEDYNEESRDFAHVIQRNLVEDLSPQMSDPHDRGVKQAPFIVLIGSNMPSILTEIGFISNPADERYFRQEEARNQVADALFRGVEAYLRSLGGVPDQQSAASGS